MAFAFKVTTRRTTLTRLTVKKIPKGATLRASCRPRKGSKRCGIKAYTKRNASASISVKRFLGKRLRPGSVVELRVTKAGRIGAVKLLKIRKRKAPTTATKCLPLNSKTPAQAVLSRRVSSAWGVLLPGRQAQVLAARDLAPLEAVTDDLADVALLGESGPEGICPRGTSPLLADHVQRDPALLALLRTHAAEGHLLLVVGAAQIGLRPWAPSRSASTSG